MNSELLIDAIVRQTTVLIAQLSTAAGLRTPLASVADQVFLELTAELERQGVTKKVAADMFGLALRSYQIKVQRLQTSRSQRDRTLWEGILALVHESSQTRSEIIEHFRADDPTNVRAILTDLVRSGLLIKSVGTHEPSYEVAKQMVAPDSGLSSDALQALVWVAVFRGAEKTEDITAQFRVSESATNDAILRLLKLGRVRMSTDGRLRATGVDIPVGSEEGWEASVFDHFQAMVSAIGQKVTQGETRSASTDHVGGTTITFEVDANHPLRQDALALLKRTREETDDLFERIRAHNQAHPLSEETKEHIHFYFGQSVREAD